MKNVCATVVLIGLSTSALFAQKIAHASSIKWPSLEESRFSALTKVAVYESTRRVSHSFLRDYYGIDPQDPLAIVSGLVQFNSNNHSQAALLCRALRGGNTGVYSFSIYVKDLAAFTKHPSVRYVSLDRKASMQLNNARKDIGADRVHVGLDLPMPYTGKGIITGLVDIGLEYTHPSFRNESGDSTRILQAWAQNLKVGKHPNGFDYGVEFVGQRELYQAQFDSMVGPSHGTIVLGCMAAGGYGSEGKYKGIAPASDIIAITSNYQESSLFDGMIYFFNETQKRGKRGVFNLSWGSQIGPHDGTSLFDQSMDSLINTGAVVIGAAGNWGETKLHLKHPNTASSTTTLIKQGNSSDFSICDIWGQPLSRFSVQLHAIDKTSGSVTHSSYVYPTQSNADSLYRFVFGKDTTTIYIINTARDARNKRPNSFVAFRHDPAKTNHQIALTITSSRNEVHAWGGQNASFTNQLENGGTMPNYTDGNTEYTIGELGGTSKNLLTAGSHLSRSAFVNIGSERRKLSVDSGMVTRFSSQGPTLDGRIKPEITAPTGAAFPANRFSPWYKPVTSQELIIQDGLFQRNDSTWCWIVDEATSFSAPIVSGAAALLLEADPTLTGTQIKDRIIKAAKNDAFTGNIATTGSNKWGWGKLNIYQAISAVVTGQSEKQIVDKGWHSNPVKESMVFFYPQKPQPISMEVYTMLGSQWNGGPIIATPIGGDFFAFELKNIPVGQYLGHIALTGGEVMLVKITKVD